jgi:hypothetical protein
VGIVEDQQAICDALNERDAPEGRTALELHQAVYRDKRQPLSVRLRAAKEALPYENPKLAVVGHLRDDEEFGALLDRAIARSLGKPVRLIEHRRKEQVDDAD